MSIKSKIAENRDGAAFAVWIILCIILNVVLSFAALPGLVDLGIVILFFVGMYRSRLDEKIIEKILKDFHL